MYLLVLLVPAHVYASEESYDQVNGMVKQLSMLYKTGVSLQKKYDFNDMSQLSTCINKYGELRDQVKFLQQQARTIPFSYRMDMTFAADAAFSCVYCGGRNSAKQCSEIPKYLETLKKKLQEDGKNNNG